MMGGSVSNDAIDPATVLVAIPTLNEARHIEHTLQDLLSDAPGIERVKIVVSDGGSTDGTRAIVSRLAEVWPNIHLIDNPDRLQSAGINRVVFEHAEPHHEILVRIDAHAHYSSDYVLNVARSLRQRRSAAVATVMDSTGESCFQRGAAWVMETRMGSGGSGHRGGRMSGWVDHGHHAGFLLETFRRVGGYDTSFVANEDAELDCRIRETGGRIWLDADIRLGYVMRPSLRGLALQYWHYGRGRAQTVIKHQLRPRLRQMVPPVTVASNVTAVIVLPILPFGLMIPILYLFMVAAVTASVVLRHRSLCGLWAGPAVVAMHHMWGAGFLWQLLRGHPAQLED